MYTSTSPYAGIVGLVMSAECPVCEHKLPFEADCQWCALKEECESWQAAHDAMCALNARTTEERDRLAVQAERLEKALGHALHLVTHNKGMCVRCREARGRIDDALANTREMP